MLDFRVSSHPHFDGASQKFAAAHNVKELAAAAGIKPRTLYNKLNPEHEHQLAPPPEPAETYPAELPCPPPPPLIIVTLISFVPGVGVYIPDSVIHFSATFLPKYPLASPKPRGKRTAPFRSQNGFMMN